MLVSVSHRQPVTYDWTETNATRCSSELSMVRPQMRTGFVYHCHRPFSPAKQVILSNTSLIHTLIPKPIFPLAAHNHNRCTYSLNAVLRTG